MNFWKLLRFVMVALLIVIAGLAAFFADKQEEGSAANEPAAAVETGPAPQGSGKTFN